MATGRGPRDGAADALAAGWLDVLFQTTPTGVGVVDTLANRYVRVNQAMADIMDLTVEELLACDPFSLAMRTSHPDDLMAEQKLFAEMASGVRRFYRIEKRFVRKDGSWRWGLLTFSGLYGDPVDAAAPVGPLHAVVLHIVDIDAHKTMEQTLKQREEELRHAQKVDGIGRLAAGVAHDFNNLLTIITGYGEMLKDRVAAPAPSSNDQIEGLEAILEAAERATSLTTQLLAHGRRETVSPKTFALSEAVRRLQQLVGRTIGSHIQVDLALDAQGAIHADEGQVAQVVLNLILNARDAIADNGRISVTTRDLTVTDGTAGALPGPGTWVALAVSDDGHGMTPDIVARIFEPFFTTRDDRPGTQGTGLGLATVKRIVTDIGGLIDVKSAPGAGTTITIYLPRAVKAPPPPAKTTVTGRTAIPPNTRRVLVVEDNPAVRSLVANILLGAHYLVIVARDGQEAMRFIEDATQPFDLIVTDMAMPTVGGMALAERLRARGPVPPMLFISGYSRQTPADLAPFGTLLPKPFTPAQLLDAVEQALYRTQRTELVGPTA